MEGKLRMMLDDLDVDTFEPAPDGADPLGGNVLLTRHPTDATRCFVCPVVKF